MKRPFILLSLALAAIGMNAQTRLFHTGDHTGYPYRIPAIATAVNGDVIALSDLRPCGGDIGYGRVDIMQRISADNGATWSDAVTVLQGTGSGPDTGYGDACLVADRERNELLLVCVSGDVPYWNSKIGHTQRMVCTHATYNKKARQWQWNTDKPIDLTQQVYEGIFNNRINGLFMGSGRICQSRQVKVGRYYRLYAALCTHRGNYVIYSDDFGRTWAALGPADQSCAPKGDEPKCEELPDGSVLLSSRKHGGRYFNIFRYTDVKHAKGIWGAPVDSRQVDGGISNDGTPRNGEIMLVQAKAKADGSRAWIALQSIPAGPNRSNVTIYWKPLRTQADYLTPRAFAAGWQGHYQVSTVGSAYSTMTLQRDGHIGFFYEEEPGYYQMIYRSLTLDEITGGQWTLCR